MIDNTHYNLTFKLALAGIDGDHVNEHFADWAAKKVATFEIQPEGRVASHNSNLAPNTRLVAYGRLDSSPPPLLSSCSSISSVSIRFTRMTGS